MGEGELGASPHQLRGLGSAISSPTTPSGVRDRATDDNGPKGRSQGLEKMVFLHFGAPDTEKLHL